MVLNKTKEVKTKIKEIVEVKLIRMPKRRSSIIFVGGIILSVNDGRKIRIKVVVIVEVQILLTNVVTPISSLVRQIL